MGENSGCPQKTYLKPVLNQHTEVQLSIQIGEGELGGELRDEQTQKLHFWCCEKV